MSSNQVAHESLLTHIPRIGRWLFKLTAECMSESSNPARLDSGALYSVRIVERRGNVDPRGNLLFSVF